MKEANILQKVIIRLRNSEVRMAEGDHVGFGVFFCFFYLLGIWSLADGNVAIFLTANLAPIVAVPLYYWNRSSRARKSWYWEDVRRKLRGQNVRKMWDTCDNGEWLLWFVAHMVGKAGWPSHQQVVIASCQCARLALKHVEGGELNPRSAIEAAEAWAHGRLSSDEVRTAGIEASRSQHGNTTFCAAKAAESSSWAVHACEDGDSFRFAQAASGAASWAKSAEGNKILESCGFKNRDNATQAENAILRDCADIARTWLCIPAQFADDSPIYAWIKRWHRNGDGQRTGRMRWIPVAVSRSSPKVRLDGSEICSKSVSITLKVGSRLMAFFTIAALVVAMGDKPSEYYFWLRWLIFVTALVLIWRGDVQGSWKWAYILAPIAILFNPIIPVYIHRNPLEVVAIWHTIDAIVAILIGFVIVLMEVNLAYLRRFTKTLQKEARRS